MHKTPALLPMTKKESRIKDQELRKETKVEEPAKSKTSKVVGEQVMQESGNLRADSEGFGPSGTLKPDEQAENRNKKQSIFITPLSAKTFFISQFFILIAGLIFTAGLYYFLNSGNKLDDWQMRGPLTQTPKSLNLEISNPDDSLVVFNKNLVVSGRTSPNTSVIISNNGSDLALESNKKGDFSKIINLDSGVNQISVTSIDLTGNSKALERTIYYSEEKLQ